MVPYDRTYTAKSKLELMTKAEYKQKLLNYIDEQLDKLTVKQIRTLLTSYARR